MSDFRLHLPSVTATGVAELAETTVVASIAGILRFSFLSVVFFRSWDGER